MSGRDDGRRLSVDAGAESAAPGLPAFLARSAGAPVYHGFTVLDDVSVEGFLFGTITEIDPAGDDAGDAFVVAPDGSRCGLVWEVRSEPAVEEIIGFEERSWGVWGVGFPHPIASPQDARRNLEAVLPLLRPKWEAWRDAGFGHRPG